MSMSRYARQLCLEEIGSAGQQRIETSRVLVVGAGGLGCAVLPYLCAAGVGHLTILDHDRVEESNLHRQPLYRTADVGLLKVQVARRELMALNPAVIVTAVCERLTPANAATLVRDADVVVDCADSFAVTYTLSDECRLAGKPLVSASVTGLSGYAGAFCGNAPSYRAVFPELPAQITTCATAGVLGTAVGVIGTLQSQLTLSLLVGMKPDVSGRLIQVDFRTLRFSGFSFGSAPEPQGGFPFVAREQVTDADLTVDLRETAEAPTTAFANSLRMSVEAVGTVASGADRSRRVVLCCRSGLRAWRAGSRLRAAGHDNIALLALGD